MHRILRAASAWIAVMTRSYALQSGGESAVQGNGKGILRALQVAKTRIDQSRPLVCCQSPVFAMQRLLRQSQPLTG